MPNQTNSADRKEPRRLICNDRADRELRFAPHTAPPYRRRLRGSTADVGNKGRSDMESVEELAKKAIVLDPKERVRLVEAILYSLDKPDPEIEKSWIAESEARYEAYKRGELQAEDWDEIRKRYER